MKTAYKLHFQTDRWHSKLVFIYWLVISDSNNYTMHTIRIWVYFLLPWCFTFTHTHTHTYLTTCCCYCYCHRRRSRIDKIIEFILYCKTYKFALFPLLSSKYLQTYTHTHVLLFDQRHLCRFIFILFYSFSHWLKNWVPLHIYNFKFSEFAIILFTQNRKYLHKYNNNKMKSSSSSRRSNKNE